MDKPIPKMDSGSQAYWDACAREELIYQHCTGCGLAQFYPRVLCVHCKSTALEYRRSSGRGTVYALTIVHVGQPSFKQDVPYPIAIIELDEGFRMMTNIVGDREALKIGARGRIVFEARGPTKLPQFTLTA